MGSDQFEMLRKETESLKSANITLLQLQEKQSEQTTFVVAQMASVKGQKFEIGGTSNAAIRNNCRYEPEAGRSHGAARGNLPEARFYQAGIREIFQAQTTDNI